MKGKVKFFAEDKGFGFIEVEGEDDVFVHRDAIKEGVALHEGDEVVFDTEQGPKGLKAINVTKGESDKEEESDMEEESDKEEELDKAA